MENEMQEIKKNRSKIISGKKCCNYMNDDGKNPDQCFSANLNVWFL